MRILMVAPPGAGKGTQAARLAAHYGIEHLASGDLLRHELSTGTELGNRAREFVDRGDLVPDALVMRLVLDRAVKAAARGGFVLDGFPRNLGQAEAAYDLARHDTGLTLHAVVHLEVGRAEVRRRILARSSVDERTDDKDAVIEHRLAVYDEQTEPLLEYYRERGILVSVDGEQTMDEVTAELFAALDSVRTGN